MRLMILVMKLRRILCYTYHFSIGDYLCRKNIIPSEILIISEGERINWGRREECTENWVGFVHWAIFLKSRTL